VVGRIARLGALLLTFAVSAIGSIQLAALRGAGFNGTAPPGAAAVKQLISTLTDNWKWLISTGTGLVLVLIAGLMVFGSQRAPDHMFRVVGGIIVILVVIPAVLA
jgi:hypothetical protein